MTTTFFTGNGDSGTSSIGEQNIAKNEPIMQFLGVLDECNSHIGLAVTTSNHSEITKTLTMLQQNLFVLQAEIAGIAFGLPSKVLITNRHTELVEKIINKLDVKIPKIDYFVLPGGGTLAAQCDVARAISRRVERLAVEFTDTLNISEGIIKYLNRLSSILFVLARYANVADGVDEINPDYK